MFIFQDDRQSAKDRQGEDLKAAVEMNPKTKEKSNEGKSLQSGFMRCRSNEAPLVSTRLITGFISEELSELD